MLATPGWLLGFRWLDWAGLTLGAVSVAALGVALWQLRRTTRAAQAAQTAATRTERHAAFNQLLVSMPQLTTLENALYEAAHDDDPRAAQRTLARWREVANEIRGLLSDDTHHELRRSLQGSVVTASEAKMTLLMPNKKVTTATKQMIREMGKICDETNTLAGEMKAYPDREVEQ